MTEVLTPRPAATCMVLRDGDDGVEVLLLRRNPRSVFVPGAHVFPGGAVEPSDGESLDEAYRYAAVRETFEEAGLLFADGPVEAAMPFRAAVACGEVLLADLCREHGLRLRLDDLREFGHWTTPPGGPRRYTTRFFVAPAPADQVHAHDDAELVDSEWIRPQAALDRFATGDWELILPTERSLVALTHFESTAEVLAHLDTHPPTTDDHGGWRVAIPQETAL